MIGRSLLDPAALETSSERSALTKNFVNANLRWLLTSLSVLYFASSGWAENWPGWRGPRGDGTSREENVPTRWSASSGEGIAWKTSLLGEGHSSPVVWGDKVFVTSANIETEERLLLCCSRQDGRILWQKNVLKAPLERKHRENSFASSTPATDGERVYVPYLDKADVVVAAYDLNGSLQWQVRPGQFASIHGFSASPVLFEDKVIVNGDHDGDAWIAALSRNDGRTLWKISRENKTRSYCTPIIRELAGRTQMILSGSKCVASYNPRDGERHWIIDGPTEQFVASIVYNAKHDMLFVTGGYPDLHLLGVRPNGTGNVTATHVAWRANKGVSYVPSPIAEGDYFLVLSDAGIASCYHARTGSLQWQHRAGRHAHSSLISADGLDYITTDEGSTTVVKPGPAYAEIAVNELGQNCYSSPAVSEGQIFLRGDKDLFCVGQPRQPR